MKIKIKNIKEEFDFIDENKPEDKLVNKDIDQNNESESSEDVSGTDKEQALGKEVSEEVATEEESPSEGTSKDTAIEEVPVEEVSAEVATEEESSSEGTSKGTETNQVSVEQETPETELKFNFKNLIGRKIGMTQLFSDEGNVYPATIVEAGPCSVIQIKNTNNDGYNAVQIGFSDIKESKINNSLKGHFEKSRTSPKKFLKEFRINNIENLPKIGDIIDLHQFNVGEFITVKGFSIGKGFAGHMKRHGFSGGRASHGKNSVMRKSGSVGAGTDPGRIFPGMKMAGRMGNDKVTIKNLKVLNIDYKNNLIFIKGSIPGSKNNYLFLTKD